MSPRLKKKPKVWTFTAAREGTKGTVYTYERVPGGVLYGMIRNPVTKRRLKRSLGHRDRDLATAWAWEQLEKLQGGATELHEPSTVGAVLAAYLTNRTPQKKSDAHQAEDRRRAEMWRRVLGAKKRVKQLGRAEWDQFKELRASGAIDSHGRAVPDELDENGRPRRRPVGPATVDGDLVFINSVFNWALQWNDPSGQRLLDKNPWGAAAPGVKRALERPRNRAPLRPIATYDRYLKLHDVADRVLMFARKGDPGAVKVQRGVAVFGKSKTPGPVMLWMRPSYFGELLELAEQTGRRIEAICRLWYSDFIRENGVVVSIRWRPFKSEDETIVTISDDTRATIDRILSRRPGVGDHWVFPSPRKPEQHIDKHLAWDWMKAAEELAGLAHMKGGGWHPYRRKWATERKHHPRGDVMKAGGWKDERSLANCYTMTDDDTIVAVVNEPRKLIERRGS